MQTRGTTFTAAVEEARLEIIEKLRKQLREKASSVFSDIETLLDDPNAPPDVALDAAVKALGLHRRRLPLSGTRAMSRRRIESQRGTQQRKCPVVR